MKFLRALGNALSRIANDRIRAMEVSMPTAEEFREQLLEVFRIAEQNHQASVVIKAGDLHRALGEYPNRKTQRMPVCCGVMRSAMHKGDVIVYAPPKGKGATLTIRYALPRPRPGGTA